MSTLAGPPPACRSCGQGALFPVLSLGRLPLANALLTRERLDEPEPCYPLDLVLCPSCSLVQITATVEPERLFRQYLYFSSYSDTFLRHAEVLVEQLIEERRPSGDSLVIEIASNDGYLLQYYKRRGVPVLGVEPARNVAEVARARGIPTVSEFFDLGLAARLREGGQEAVILHAHNVLAHATDLNGFVAGIRMLLREGGLAVVEVPYVMDMIEKCEFDTIYHEHLCYFSLTSLDQLLRRHRLAILKLGRPSVHGGSLRLFVAHAGAVPSDSSVAGLLAEEARLGVGKLALYEDFGRRVAELIGCLRRQLRELRVAGHRIAAYGAAAKGAILLNSLRIEPDVIEFVVDRSPHKQGHFLPGLHLAIRPPDALLEEQPDYVLLLAWNLAEEVLEQQAEFRRRGGRFIIPVPEPRIV